jgi:glucose/arabinose dehydrogenase
VPDYALGRTRRRSASLLRGDRAAGRYRDGCFIGQHGSWNRKPRSGYKVIFVPFAAAVRPAAGRRSHRLRQRERRGARAAGRRRHRSRGALLVADDVGNVVWRVAPGPAKAAMGR